MLINLNLNAVNVMQVYEHGLSFMDFMEVVGTISSKINFQEILLFFQCTLTISLY